MESIWEGGSPNIHGLKPIYSSTFAGPGCKLSPENFSTLIFLAFWRLWKVLRRIFDQEKENSNGNEEPKWMKIQKHFETLSHKIPVTQNTIEINLPVSPVRPFARLEGGVTPGPVGAVCVGVGNSKNNSINRTTTEQQQNNKNHTLTPPIQKCPHAHLPFSSEEVR